MKWKTIAILLLLATAFSGVGTALAGGEDHQHENPGHHECQTHNNKCHKTPKPTHTSRPPTSTPLPTEEPTNEPTPRPTATQAPTDAPTATDAPEPTDKPTDRPAPTPTLTSRTVDTATPASTDTVPAPPPTLVVPPTDTPVVDAQTLPLCLCDPGVDDDRLQFVLIGIVAATLAVYIAISNRNRWRRYDFRA